MRNRIERLFILIFLMLTNIPICYAQAGEPNKYKSLENIATLVYLMLFAVSIYQRSQRKIKQDDIKDNSVLSIVIGIILYFLFAWIIKDIIYSIDTDISLKGAYQNELVSALFATVLATTIALFIRGVQITRFLETLLFPLSLILILVVIFFLSMPISTGAIILINIVNVGYIICVTNNP